MWVYHRWLLNASFVCLFPFFDWRCRYVRRISLRVAFAFLVGSILSFAFYYEFMDMVKRVDSNTSAFTDLHYVNPCTRSQNVAQVPGEIIYTHTLAHIHPFFLSLCVSVSHTHSRSLTHLLTVNCIRWTCWLGALVVRLERTVVYFVSRHS